MLARFCVMAILLLGRSLVAQTTTEAEIIADWKRDGVQFGYDEKGIPLYVELPALNKPFVMEELKLASKVRGIRYLTLNSKEVSSAALAIVPEFNDLISLEITTTSVDAAGIAHLSKCRQLKTLNLPVSADGRTLEGACQLLQLEQLMVTSEKITDDDLVHVSKLSNLNSLYLGRNITSVGLEKLGPLKNLQHIYAPGPLDDAAVPYLVRFPAIMHLSFSREAVVTDEGLAHLKDARNLKVLNLPNRATDASAEAVATLAKLQNLDLRKTQWTSRGLSHLAANQELRLLVCPETAGDEGIASLESLPELMSLTLIGGNYTDKCLAHVERIKSLKNLNLWRTAVTADAIGKLRQRRGDIKVRIEGSP